MVQSSTRRTAGFAAVAGAAVLALAVVAPTLAQSPAASRAAGGGKLFVAINKAADQQYFIDLQNSFVSTIEAARRHGAEVRRQASRPSSA